MECVPSLHRPLWVSPLASLSYGVCPPPHLISCVPQDLLLFHGVSRALSPSRVCSTWFLSFPVSHLHSFVRPTGAALPPLPDLPPPSRRRNPSRVPPESWSPFADRLLLLLAVYCSSFSTRQPCSLSQRSRGCAGELLGLPALQSLSSFSSRPRSRPAQQPVATAHSALLLRFSLFFRTCCFSSQPLLA